MITIKDSSWNILKEIPADLNKTLLEQLVENWVDIPAACYTWICGACMCEVEAGSSEINKNFKWEEWFPTDEAEVMTCIAWVKDPNAEIILKSIY